MRVIGGEFRRRTLQSLPGLDVRPTPDRLREALFNILAPRIEHAIFADLYAGTGAVGIEALSRGAGQAIFVEEKYAAAKTIRDNLRALGIENRAEVRQGRAIAMIPRVRADMVFLDPPFALVEEYAGSLDLLGAMPPALVIVQHPPRLKLADRHGELKRTRFLKQGDNALSFFEPESMTQSKHATEN